MPDPILIVMHQETSTPRRVGHALRKRGYAVDRRRPRFGDALPDTLGEHAGAIIFGGPMSANDEDDFIRREIDWLAAPLRENQPFRGICLGAQMLAHHLGSRVYKHPDGHAEVGYYPIQPTDVGRSVCDPWPEQVYQWHREGFDLRLGVRAAISSRCDTCDDVQVDYTRTRPHAAAERQAQGGALRGSPRL